MALLSVLNGNGHAVLEFDKTEEDEVEVVRQKFDEMVAKGYLGYADGVPTVTFNREAELTTMAPLVAGG